MSWNLTRRIIDGAQNTLRNIPEGAVTNLTADLTGKQPVLAATAVKTSAYTAAVGDLIPADATSAGFTVTLPTAPADKARIVIKKVDSSANAVTVTAGGADVFNTAAGPTSFSLSLQNQAAQLQYISSTSVWVVISTDVPLSGLDARYRAAGALTAADVGGFWFPPAYLLSGNYYYCNSLTSTTTGTVTNTSVRTTPWIVTQSITITRLFLEFTVAGEANSYYRIGIWSDDGTGRPSTLALDGGTISTGSGNAGDVASGGTPGVYEITVSKALTPGLYHVGGCVQNAPTTVPTFRIVTAAAIPFMATLGTTKPTGVISSVGWSGTAMAGALVNLASPTLTSSAPRIGFKVA